MSLKDLLGIIRAPFLILTPMCVLLGVSMAFSKGIEVSVLNLVLVFAGGLLAHVSVNSLNEYFDFKSGLDFKTIKTPFSGGSGTLVAKPHLAGYALFIGLISAAFVIIIGLYFVFLRGEQMLLFGLIGLLCVILYPILFVKNAFFALISPGLGFGTSMVIGTYLALGADLGIPVILASLVPFFLVNNLLLLNQFPDMEADRDTGRENFVIKFGRRRAALIYSLFLMLTYITIILSVVAGYFRITALIGLLTIGLAIPAGVKAFRFSDDLKNLMPALGMNVGVNLLTPLLLAIGMFLRL